GRLHLHLEASPPGENRVYGGDGTRPQRRLSGQHHGSFHEAAPAARPAHGERPAGGTAAGGYAVGLAGYGVPGHGAGNYVGDSFHRGTPPGRRRISEECYEYIFERGPSGTFGCRARPLTSGGVMAS